jgi:phytoene synthase
LSWLFAAPAVRPVLLGVYALSAEWSALLDPGTEREVAFVKLAWWQDEMRRLQSGSAAHPISRYLAGLSPDPGRDFAALLDAVQAVASEADGVPVESTAHLAPHARKLHGGPLLAAALASDPTLQPALLGQAIDALAEGEYLQRALGHYARAARLGRIVFPVSELMEAGIDNTDLVAIAPPPHLARYLQAVRRRSQERFAAVSPALPPAQRRAQRHLLVLADLGAKRLNSSTAGNPGGLADMLRAWNRARRA